MDYKNIKPYIGDMSSSDLCDAIVEARNCEIPEVLNATRLLVDDLRDAILSADKIYYLKSTWTNSPYINERFSVCVFDDFYYAEKFVERNETLNLSIVEVQAPDYEKTFAYLYECGAEGIDYCNDTCSVGFGVQHYFLTDDYQTTLDSARILNRFILLCMQEIRNENRQYERKEDIVTLLKKNIIAEALTANVFIPVQSVGDGDVSQPKEMRVATMSTENNELFFPVYTTVAEFERSPMDGIGLASTSLLAYIEFVYGIANTHTSVYGLAINPSSVNFAMNLGIMDLVLQNKQRL